ncbi:MAG: ribonuclease HI [Deltaproteobacteria bacterium]|nr:ribonuclease HI [Deltaproteobacteria bacterium]
MALKKKKFYAVAKGRRPGIYTDWFGPGGAYDQVKGFAGAVYKGFFTRGEAEIFCKNPPVRKWQKASPPKQTGLDKPPAAHVDGAPDTGEVIMYTDGCALNNPGPGGYGSVILMGGQRREISDGFKKTTNNRMELLACIQGLASLDKPCRVTLYSDSKYVVDGITKGWAKRWKKNGWMRTKTDPAINPDLWERLLALCDTHDVSFVWVKGHAGNPENERCDRLANMAAMGKGLPEDKGYLVPNENR